MSSVISGKQRSPVKQLEAAGVFIDCLGASCNGTICRKRRRKGATRTAWGKVWEGDPGEGESQRIKTIFSNPCHEHSGLQGGSRSSCQVRIDQIRSSQPVRKSRVLRSIVCLAASEPVPRISRSLSKKQETGEPRVATDHSRSSCFASALPSF